jgi:TetR/AcrR family transcriptional regulator, transcriptional repressor for nem operon
MPVAADPIRKSPRSRSRDQLVSATIGVVRERGYNATRVEDICAAAGVTKGSFFHHFASKDAVALAAAQAWDANVCAHFESEAFNAIADPAARVLAYVDNRIAKLQGGIGDYSCYAGTLLQEVWQTHAGLARGAAAAIENHIDWLTPVIEAALASCGKAGEHSARDLSAFIQSNVQGALIIAKAEGNPELSRRLLAHVRCYLETILLAEEPPR